MALLSSQFLGHLGYSHCWSHMRPQNWSSMFENLRGRKTSYAECECTYLSSPQLLRLTVPHIDVRFRDLSSFSVSTCHLFLVCESNFAPALRSLHESPSVPPCLYCGQLVPSNRLHYAPLLFFCTYHSYRKGYRIRVDIFSFILRLISSC